MKFDGAVQNEHPEVPLEWEFNYQTKCWLCLKMLIASKKYIIGMYLEVYKPVWMNLDLTIVIFELYT